MIMMGRPAAGPGDHDQACPSEPPETNRSAWFWGVLLARCCAISARSLCEVGELALAIGFLTF